MKSVLVKVKKLVCIMKENIDSTISEHCGQDNLLDYRDLISVSLDDPSKRKRQMILDQKRKET